ncbi:MAG: helix-turn-helix transcriptional regulator [Eubacteriales bacterium]
MKEKLKKLRLDAHLTQQEAAEKIGVGQPTISMWESGESKPRVGMLALIAETYGCKISDILDTE